MHPDFQMKKLAAGYSLYNNEKTVRIDFCEIYYTQHDCKKRSEVHGDKKGIAL